MDKIETSMYKSYNLDILSYTNISYLKIPIERQSIESNNLILDYKESRFLSVKHCVFSKVTRSPLAS